VISIDGRHHDVQVDHRLKWFRVPGSRMKCLHLPPSPLLRLILHSLNALPNSDSHRPLSRHIFCSKCMEGVVKQAGDPSDEEYRLRCPLCRAAINAHDLVTRTQTAASMQSCSRLDEGGPVDDEGADAVGGIEGGSTKLNAVLEEIGKIEGTGDGLEKAVVFSQFTSFLDIIQNALKRTGRNFRRLDGSMTRENRKMAIDQFQGDPQVTILLVRFASLPQPKDD
jgi:SNF2 family DNA or RNA helicase